MIIGRGLMNALRDKRGEAMRERAQSLVLSSSEKGDTHQQNRFETSVEDFHSVLDQMELNLRYAHGKSTASSCQNQTPYFH